jgi:SAM-dependent methyltransferase
MQTSIVTTCPVCASSTVRSLAVRLGRWEVLHCSACAADSISPSPTDLQLQDAYQDFDAGQIARKSFSKYCDQARTILRNDLAIAGIDTNQPGRFLDYGCGGGHFVKAAQDLGFSAFGLDLDAASGQFGKEHGMKIERGSAPDIVAKFGTAPFKAIVAMHVVEHVPQPIALLKQLAARLEVGGCLVLGVPDQSSFPARLKILLRKLGVKRGEWGFVQPPIHLHGFQLRTLRTIAPTLQLDIASARKTSPLDPTAFPSNDEYWQGLAMQRKVYQMGRLLGSGGHLKAVFVRRIATL